MPDTTSGSGPLLAAEVESYSTSFAGGHVLNLLDRADTFRVSRAGQALGDLLVDDVTQAEIVGRVLDVGTGSGALALLLRRLGAEQVTATDICTLSVSTAAKNELLNFDASGIRFVQGDPFPPPGATAPEALYDLIVFNPPGWRAPSAELAAVLLAQMGTLDLNAMFFGDDVIVRFLSELHTQLAPDGRAIVGFNSLVGIDDVRRRAEQLQRESGAPALQFRTLRRVELPLLYYTDAWAAAGAHLAAEFERGRAEYGAEFTVVDGVIHWGYVITEVTLGPAQRGAVPAPRTATSEAR